MDRPENAAVHPLGWGWGRGTPARIRGEAMSSAQEEIARLFTAVHRRCPTRILETKHTRPSCSWLAFARAFVSARWTVTEKECMEQDLGVGSLGQNASWSPPPN